MTHQVDEKIAVFESASQVGTPVVSRSRTEVDDSESNSMAAAAAGTLAVNKALGNSEETPETPSTPSKTGGFFLKLKQKVSRD